MHGLYGQKFQIPEGVEYRAVAPGDGQTHSISPGGLSSRDWTTVEEIRLHMGDSTMNP